MTVELGPFLEERDREPELASLPAANSVVLPALVRSRRTNRPQA
jgi:hypothetical protein